MKTIRIVILSILFFLLPIISCQNSTEPEKTRIGAVCKDGTTSTATGSGACSSHGGVDYWVYE